MAAGIQDLLDAIARVPRDRVALSTPEGDTRYGDLCDAAGHVARELLDRGCRGPDRIAIFARSHSDIVSSMLGTLAADCAFAPLDPTLPDLRLARMLEVLECRLAIVAPALRTRWNGIAGAPSLLAIPPACLRAAPRDERSGAVEKPQVSSSSLVRRPADPDAMACVYFTSGSTHTPRAVAGRRCGIDHHVAWEVDFLGLDRTVRGSILHSPAYDAYLPDVLVPLCAGGVACAPNRDALADPERLCAWLEASEISLMHCVPSLFRALLLSKRVERLGRLRSVLLAGEVVRPADVRRARAIFRDRVRLVNLYGPTEATLVKLHHEIRAEDATGHGVPIGHPMPGVSVQILDPDDVPIVSDAIGQIAIRSRYGALGYLGEPELTAERFKPCPHRPDEQIYLTGDLGHRRADGEIVFVGRADRQHKVRGARVDLDELEAWLHELDGVCEAAAVADVASCGDVTLHAFVRLTADATLSEITTRAEAVLPPPMHPSSWTTIETWPRTVSGKLDRRALVPTHPAPEPPRTALEASIASIFAAVLEVDAADVGRHSSFFALGGHSLNGGRVLAAIEDGLGVAVDFCALMEAPTVTELAARVGEAPPAADLYPRASSSARPKGTAPATPEHHALWLFAQVFPDSPAPNVFAVYRVRGDLDAGRLAACLRTVHRRHPALRAAFVAGSRGELTMRTVDLELQIDTLDLRRAPDDARSTIEAWLRAPFDLDEGRLWAATVVRTHDREHLVAINTHHIASDGMTYPVLLREIGALYAGDATAERVSSVSPDLAYERYAHWRRDVIAGPRGDVIEAYAIESAERALPITRLPTDHTRPSHASFDGGQVCARMSRTLVRDLERAARQRGATFFMAFLSGLLAVLHRVTGAPRVTVATTVANRPRPELEHVVGLFANFALVGASVHDDPSFAELLARVRVELGAVLAHQDAPFVSALSTLQQAGADMPGVLVSHFGELALELPGLEVERVLAGNGTTTHDLMILVEERRGERDIVVQFRTQLFLRSSVERLLQSTLTLLAEGAAEPETPLSRLPLLASRTPLFTLRAEAGAPERPRS